MDAVNLRNYFFYLATSVVIIAGLKVASEIVVLLFLSIFISSIISSLLKFLQKGKVPKLISYLIVLSIIMIFSLLVYYIINISLKDFLSNINSYEKGFNDLIVSTISLIEQYGYTVDKDQILQTLNLSSFFGFTTNLIGNIGSFLSKFLLIIIGIAFILAESKSFETKLKMIFRSDAQKLKHFNLFSHNIQKYFLVKSTTSFLTGFIIAITLIYFDVDYPILWGVIAMLFNFVPVVGSIIAAIPAVLLSLLNADINTTIILIILYMTINISISNIIEPKLMGKELGLSPLVIFFSLILWGWVLGIVGMFLAVPITMTLKIAFNSNSSTHWIAILMSDLSKNRKDRESKF
ncbi:AI-2E family transporter [Arcobacter sp. YIC-464]|uniref:AI-2E family transporter n=1 Tax=Arcobacter sp. YIC-464 TaxID=3376631 RepID=UPI003C2390C8